jgi:hypothetical protein
MGQLRDQMISDTEICKPSRTPPTTYSAQTPQPALAVSRSPSF